MRYGTALAAHPTCRAPGRRRENARALATGGFGAAVHPRRETGPLQARGRRGLARAAHDEPCLTTRPHDQRRPALADRPPSHSQAQLPPPERKGKLMSEITAHDQHRYSAPADVPGEDIGSTPST